MSIFVEELKVHKILGNTITGRFNHHLSASCPEAGRYLEFKFCLCVFF